MIKAFISHSSAQKEFVRELAKAIGLDFCIVDEMTFEGGKLIMKEIEKSIEKCDIFVFLISNEALNSDWVKTELSNIRDYIDEKKFSAFMPFIIDEDISHDDPRIKSWIRNDYNLEKYKSPILLSRRIKEKIREIKWEKYPSIQQKENLFKGRDNELGLLDQKYYDSQIGERRCVIVSGFPSGVGRRRLIKEYILTKVATNKDKTYEPTCIELSENESIEDLIYQLNDLFLQYKNDDILDIGRKTKEEKIATTISLINFAIQKKEYIIIRDNGACVLSNGKLSSWFKDIITSPSLEKKVCLFVASLYFVNNTVEQNYMQIIALQINPLSRQYSKVLLYAYAEISQIQIHKDIEDEILKNISGIPPLIFRCVDIVKDAYTDSHAIKQILGKVKSEEKCYVAILDIIRKDDPCFQTLILLSQFEFVSFDIIYKIFEKLDVKSDDLLQKLQSYCLYERFGGNRQYIRVNHVVYDYIKREDLKLNNKFKDAFEQQIKNKLISSNISQNDLSGYLYGIKENIRLNIKGIDKKYLIPSFTLNAVIEEYKAGRNDNVIILCDKFLTDSNNYYSEIVRSIRYWLCEALCKKQDNRFYNEIEEFRGYSKEFLYGFFYRCKKDYKNAHDCYQKALSLSNDSNDKNYVAKAKHELVIVKMLMKDYTGALELSKENYESQKTNKYHIEAYFRCLIRSKKTDRIVLEKLLSEYSCLILDEKNKTILETLKAEFDFYINKDFISSITKLKSLISKANSNIRYYPYRSLHEISEKRDAKSISYDIIKTYGESILNVREEEND